MEIERLHGGSKKLVNAVISKLHTIKRGINKGQSFENNFRPFCIDRLNKKADTSEQWVECQAWKDAYSSNSPVNLRDPVN